MMEIATLPGECVLCGGLGCGVPLASGWDFEYRTTLCEFEMVRCRNWKHLFLSRMPSPTAMSIIYPPQYYSFSETAHERPLIARLRGRLEAGKIRRMAKFLSQPAKSILDVGCGDGRLLDILRRNGFSDCILDGLEISQAAAQRARAKGYGVRCTDFNDFNPGDWPERYDIVLCHQVIEHLRSPCAALRSLHALLRPGAILSLETPDVEGWDARLFRNRFWGGYHFPRHLHLFNRMALTRLLQKNGFRVVHAAALPSPVFWILSLHNWLTDRKMTAKLAGRFHYQNVLLLTIATLIDLAQIRLTGKSSNMQILAQKI